MIIITSCKKEAEDTISKRDSSVSRDFDQTLFNQAVKDEVEKTLTRMGQANLVGFTHELMERENQLAARRIEIEAKYQELELAQRDLEGRAKQFHEEQVRFLGCIDDKAGEIGARVTHMVNVISGMRPQNASELLSVQDPELSVMILEKLNPETVSRIFNQMDSEISAQLQKLYLNMKQ